MKATKVLLTATALFFILLSSQAQSRVNFGIKGGLNVSTIYGIVETHDDFDYEQMDYQPGFHIGLAMECMFTRNMGIETGLYFSQLGGKSEGNLLYVNDERLRYDYSATPQYLQIPALFLYKFELSPGFYLYPSSGLYFAYGVSGERTTNSAFGENNSDYFDNGNRRFDMGFVFMGNIQYQKLVAGLGFEAGFIPINEGSTRFYNDDGLYNDKLNLFNRNFKLSVGYMF